MFQCIPAGSWLVCVQCDDHAAARRPSCQGGCGGGGAALLRLTGWQVLWSLLFLRYQPLYARMTSFETGDLPSIFLVMLLLPLPRTNM